MNRAHAEAERNISDAVEDKYLYLDRCDFGEIGPICRLTYKGKLDDWEFVIFMWTTEKYDPHEWMFPDNGHVDGTIKGAMLAESKAYQT